MTTDAATKFYAPQVRLVDSRGELVGATRVAGAEGEEPRVHLDIQSVRVTLVNTGVGQCQIVLNNQIFDAEGRPRTPPWRYNGLDKIKFGQRFRVEMTYGHAPWTKMILAQVNDIQFGFGPSGAQVTVTGEDLLCLFKRKPSEDHRYDRGRTEHEIVANVVERAGGAPRFTGRDEIENDGRRDGDGWVESRGPRIGWPDFAETLPSVTHQKSQSFLQFLQTLADRMDFEIFVDFAKNYLPHDETGQAATRSQSTADPTPNDVLLHFEPARSLLAGGEPPFVVDLAWGVNLVDFAPKLKMWDLATAIDLKGRTPTRVERVHERIDTDAEVDDLVREDLGRVAGGPFLEPATALRRQYMQFAGVPDVAPVEVDFTNLDRDRALLMAKALFRAKVRELVSVEATSIGFPSLRPGIHVDVTGMYAPFDGLYYVTKTVHTIDASGYKTALTLRRPGLQAPGDYPWAEAA